MRFTCVVCSYSVFWVQGIFGDYVDVLYSTTIGKQRLGAYDHVSDSMSKPIVDICDDDYDGNVARDIVNYYCGTYCGDRTDDLYRVYQTPKVSNQKKI